MTQSLADRILQELDQRWIEELYLQKETHSSDNDILLAHMVVNILTSCVSEGARTSFVSIFNELIEENHENLL